MPRNYQKKTDRQSWSKISMEKAIDAVKKNEMGWLRTSKIYGVPQATLRRHCNEQNKTIAPCTKGLGRYKAVFTSEMERELVAHIKLLETRPFEKSNIIYAAETCTTSTTVFEEGTSAVDNPDLPSTSQAGQSATVRPFLIEDPPTSELLEKTATVPVSQISPLPKGVYVTGQGKRKPRKKPTVLLLTSTPNMEEAKMKSAPPPVSKKRTRNVTKALNFSSSSDEDFSSLQTCTSAITDEEDCPCIYCNDLFSRSKPKEVRLQCLNCKKWAHASCANVPKRTKSFICELCTF